MRYILDKISKTIAFKRIDEVLEPMILALGILYVVAIITFAIAIVALVIAI